jgi:hypothetical protein
MRVVLVILFMLPFAVFGQPGFAKQLSELVKDSTNNFKSFKSKFKETRFTEASPDSIFYTSILLDNTSNNELLIAKSESIFMADVADSLTEIKGKKIVDDWKEMVNSILGGDFAIEEVKTADGTPSSYGWIFTKGNVTVNIGLYPHKKNTNLNWIGLAVSVFEDEETGVTLKK